MITKLTARRAMSLFVLPFLYFLSSCDRSDPVPVTTDSAKSEQLNIHLVISDSYGKSILDTIYKNKFSADTLRIKNLISSTSFSDTTGGSSRCHLQMEVWKEKDDDDDDDDKN
jgi:hypothetical protein